MFGSVEAKTRPLKLAYLVDPADRKQVRRAIQISSTLWGGSFFPIIQLYRRMPKTWREKPFKTPSAEAVVSGYLEAYDPDILVQLSRDVPEYVKNAGVRIIGPDEIWHDPKDGFGRLPSFGLGIYEILDEVFDKYFKFKMKYPVEVVVPKLPARLSLFWASFFGEFTDDIRDGVSKSYSEPLEIKTPVLKVKDIGDLLSGNVMFPRRLTQYGIDIQGRSGFGRDSYVYYMDATSVDDIVDFWNLRAMGKSVLPLPRQLREDAQMKATVANFLKANRVPWRHDPKHFDIANIVRARGCTMAEIEAYAKTLDMPPDPSGTSERYYGIQHWYPRVWDEWARDKDGAVPADCYGEGSSTVDLSDATGFRVGLKTVLPEFASEYGYGMEPRCANEVSYRMFGAEEYAAEALPKSSGEKYTRAISGRSGFGGGWRVGRNGLVKLVDSPRDSWAEIPLADDVLFAWLQDRGWSVKPSPPGTIAKLVNRRLQGLLGVLTNEKVINLLEHMNGGNVSHDGTPKGDDKVTTERELPVGEVKSKLKEASENADLHDYLVKRGVFRLGLRVKCPHCSRSTWHPLGAISDTFSCPKCSDSFPAVGNVDISSWCYKTTGPFSVPRYADGAYAVLLTVDFLGGRRAGSSRMLTPALSFTAKAPGKKDLEANFAAFWREHIYGSETDGIIFGECKTYGVFKDNDLKRMRQLAKEFPGAVLVFGTLRKSLTPKELAGITSVAKAGRKRWKAERPVNPVLVLTGNELLSHHNPPYCWDEATKEKYQHVMGLLGLCAATQEIYLKLQHWQKDWHEKWERRRRRRKAKPPEAANPPDQEQGPPPTASLQIINPAP